MSGIDVISIFRQVYMTWSSKCCVVRINESQIFLKECKEKRCCLVVHCQKQMPKSSSTVWVSRISRCLQTSWKQHLGEISRRKSCSSFASSCWTICTIASVQILLRGLAMRRHYNSTKKLHPILFRLLLLQTNTKLKNWATVSTATQGHGYWTLDSALTLAAAQRPRQHQR